jgi:hypothetical protein
LTTGNRYPVRGNNHYLFTPQTARHVPQTKE